MFHFTTPLYEILAREVCEACAGGAPLEERVVEISLGGRELLFRFTPWPDGDRLGLGPCRMETWCADVRVSNDFDPEELRRIL